MKLKIIKQLEKTIGQKLTRLDKIEQDSVGYVLNKHHKIIGLKLYECGLEGLPPKIVGLQNLTKLDLSGNRLSYLPPEIGNLHNLTELDLSGNRLSLLPPEIGNLHKLTKLILWDNRLNSLPPEIGNLQNLTELLLGNPQKVIGLTLGMLGVNPFDNLEGNQLSSLPAKIGNLQNLIFLDLEGNQLNSLQAEIGNLQNLTWLNLSNNELSYLPAEIGNLQNLTSLNLHNNQFKKFPKALLGLNLEVKWSTHGEKGIFIGMNFFQTPPLEIVKQGRQAIIDHYACSKVAPPSETEVMQMPHKIVSILKNAYMRKWGKKTEL
jgi:Leucine-rich repeat (LRR) protein